MPSRGIRGNNPGNIRHSPDKWLGEVPGNDKAFKTFSDPVYGLRAIAKLLLNYESRYGLNTVSGLINRWAPTNENNTSAYIAAVAKACGVDPGQPIDVAAHLHALIPAIVRHENGSQPYTDEQIIQAIAMVTGGDYASSIANVATAPPQPAAHRIENGKVLPVGDGPLVVEKVGEGVPGNRSVTVGGVPVSKKMVVAVLGLLAVLLNRPLGLGLSDADTADLVKLLSSYLVGQSAVDAFRPFTALLLKGAK